MLDTSIDNIAIEDVIETLNTIQENNPTIDMGSVIAFASELTAVSEDTLISLMYEKNPDLNINLETDSHRIKITIGNPLTHYKSSKDIIVTAPDTMSRRDIINIIETQHNHLKNCTDRYKKKGFTPTTLLMFLREVHPELSFESAKPDANMYLT